MTAKITLRPYQQQAVSAVLDARRRGLHSCLVSLPVGSGKTVVISKIAKEFHVPTLIIAHRGELLTQAAEKFGMIWPEAPLGFVKGNTFAPRYVTLASVQTLKNPKKLAALAGKFRLIITDEAHHAIAETYQQVYRAFPGAFNLGLTATPDRADRRNLGKIYQEMVFHKSMYSMIQEKFLTPLRGKIIRTMVDISSVATKDGDFVESDLAKVVNTENRNDLIVEAYKKYAYGKKAVVFAANVEHSIALAKAFSAAGFPAAHLSGRDRKSYREEILHRLTPKGDLRIVCNVGLLTEGWDNPSIEAVLLCRPTASMPLYIQIIGRGTRLYPGKKECIVLDFVDASAKAKIVTLPELFSKEDTIRAKRERTSTEEEADEKWDERLDSVEEVVVGEGLFGIDSEIVAQSDLVWSIYGTEYRLSLFGGKEIVVQLLQDGKNASVTFQSGTDISVLDDGMPLGYAISYAEDFAREQAENLNAMRKDAWWRKQPASPTQIEKLDKWGLIYAKNITKGEASDLITRYISMVRTTSRSTNKLSSPK